MGLFNKVFGDKQGQGAVGSKTSFKFMDSYNAQFSSFGSNIYISDTVRSCIHAIAGNVAKLKPVHIRRAGKNITNTHDNIERLLQVRPNPYMSAYDMLYKTVTNLYNSNNAFIYIDTDENGVAQGFYPINYSNIEILEDSQGNLYAKFLFRNGNPVVLPYEQLIHLRRFYNTNDIFGESNEIALLPTLELINTTNQGIIHAVKSSAKLRGLLKFTQTLRPEDMKKQKEDFMNDYMNVNNDGGVAAVDSKMDYLELKSDNKLVDDKQMKFIEEKVYKYFNINEKIVTSNYTEDEWDAFYESVVEPIAIQLSLEFTSKLFSAREKGFGNEIVFEANRLQYANIKSKISLIKELAPLGMFTINECREIFNLSPVDGGEIRLQTLNVINADKADKYQIGDDVGKGGDENNGETQ